MVGQKPSSLPHLFYRFLTSRADVTLRTMLNYIWLGLVVAAVLICGESLLHVPNGMLAYG